jgi:hypothetical protein
VKKSGHLAIGSFSDCGIFPVDEWVIAWMQGKIETRNSKLEKATGEVAAEFRVSNFEFRSSVKR